MALSPVGYWPVRSRDAQVHTTLRWVIITPFGGPVVPDVYTRVARSSDFTRAIRSSNSVLPFSVARAVRPRCRRSAHADTQS